MNPLLKASGKVEWVEKSTSKVQENKSNAGPTSNSVSSIFFELHDNGSHESNG